MTYLTSIFGLDSCKGVDDGLYYVDNYSFAFCSNGQKTIQPCAEGSANPPLDYFQDGAYYAFNEFCSVNLLAQAGYLPYEYGPNDVADVSEQTEVKSRAMLIFRVRDVNRLLDVISNLRQ